MPLPRGPRASGGRARPRLRAARRPPGRRRRCACRSSRSSAARLSGCRECLGVAGRDEQGTLSVGQELPRRRRVRGDHRRAAGDRLEDLVRDDAGGFRRRAEDPERAARCPVGVAEALVLDPGDPLDVGRARLEQRVELSAAGDGDGQLRHEPGRGEDRLEPVQRDQLAHEQEAPVRAPGRMEDPFLRADQADGEALARQAGEVGEESGALVGIGHGQVGCSERGAIDPGERASRRAPGREARAVGYPRVPERDQRVEDDRLSPGRPSGGRQVELAGIADDDDIEVVVSPEKQLQLGARRAGRALLRPPSTCARPPPRPRRGARARRRRHGGGTRSPGRFADTCARTSRNRGRGVKRLLQDLLDAELHASALVRTLLVVADDHLAHEPEREELDADDHEQHTEDEQRALSDRPAGDLDAGQVDQDAGSAQAEEQPEPPNRWSGRWP